MRSSAGGKGVDHRADRRDPERMRHHRFPREMGWLVALFAGALTGGVACSSDGGGTTPPGSGGNAGSTNQAGAATSGGSSSSGATSGIGGAANGGAANGGSTGSAGNRSSSGAAGASTGGSAGSGGSTGSGGNAGSAGNAGAAGSLDAGPPDAGSADPCKPARFCENFESSDTGKAPAGPWKPQTNGGAVSVVDTERFAGSKSAKFTA